MRTYDFKQMVEEILFDDGLWEDNKIYELNELVSCMNVDEELVHEDDWEGPKPQKDIELLGEHWFKSWWDENEGDPMEGFEAL